jgi:hypothetical protein
MSETPDLMAALRESVQRAKDDRAARPKRIRLSRSKGWRMPDGAINVARPTKWGNPWIVNPSKATEPPTNQYRATADEAVDLYESWVRHAAPFTIADIRAELAGHDLACWCGPDERCHADVLLWIANR